MDATQRNSILKWEWKSIKFIELTEKHDLSVQREIIIATTFCTRRAKVFRRERAASGWPYIPMISPHRNRLTFYWNCGWIERRCQIPHSEHQSIQIALHSLLNNIQKNNKSHTLPALHRICNSLSEENWMRNGSIRGGRWLNGQLAHDALQQALLHPIHTFQRHKPAFRDEQQRCYFDRKQIANSFLHYFQHYYRHQEPHSQRCSHCDDLGTLQWYWGISLTRNQTFLIHIHLGNSSLAHPARTFQEPKWTNNYQNNNYLKWWCSVGDYKRFWIEKMI